MHASSFGSVLQFLANGFTWLLDTLDNVYLIGSFSLLDFSLVFLAMDIIITAFFVTFRVGAKNDNENKK